MPTSVTGLDEVLQFFKSLKEKPKDLSVPFNQVKQSFVSSVQTNFDLGGRPSWPPKKIITRGHTKTLIASGHLRNSISGDASPTELNIGTNVVHAPVHQFGDQGVHNVREHKRRLRFGKVRGKGRLGSGGWTSVRAHSIHQNIPARPFLTLQEEDMNRLSTAIIQFLAGQV